MADNECFTTAEPPPTILDLLSSLGNARVAALTNLAKLEPNP